jgi:AcrR family transcriptional regulator
MGRVGWRARFTETRTLLKSTLANPHGARSGLPAASRRRSERRREDTRRRLLKATYEIIAERGFEGLVIQDITQRADVGYGSFYNHFASKDAIVSAAIEAAHLRTKQMYESLDGLTADRVEAFATDMRMWFHVSTADPLWGWFMIRTVLSAKDFRSGVADLLRRAIHAGLEDGSFRYADAEMAHEVIAGLLLLGTLKLASAEVSEDYADKIVATALKTLGVPEDKIALAMEKPLSELDLPPFLEAAD